MDVEHPKVVSRESQFVEPNKSGAKLPFRPSAKLLFDEVIRLDVRSQEVDRVKMRCV